jgi:hypothetical protein
MYVIKDFDAQSQSFRAVMRNRDSFHTMMKDIRLWTFKEGKRTRTTTGWDLFIDQRDPFLHEDAVPID